jgi:hypothetical protein
MDYQVSHVEGVYPLGMGLVRVKIASIITECVVMLREIVIFVYFIQTPEILTPFLAKRIPNFVCNRFFLLKFNQMLEQFCILQGNCIGFGVVD